MTTAQRFAFYATHRNGSCIEWTGTRGHRGHGQLFEGHRRIQAHRFAWEAVHGPVPAGLVIDHLCENPPCVNPAHLEAVTPGENAIRSARTVSGIAIRKTHCLRGHPLTGDNLVANSRNERVCKICHRARVAAYRARRALDQGRAA